MPSVKSHLVRNFLVKRSDSFSGRPHLHRDWRVKGSILHVFEITPFHMNIRLFIVR
jgi:hypothetical protein